MHGIGQLFSVEMGDEEAQIWQKIGPRDGKGTAGRGLNGGVSSSAMIEFIQINLRKKAIALNLLRQTARERNADVLLLSEPPRVRLG